jgi:DNA-binding XRE family transcriptional regulator
VPQKSNVSDWAVNIFNLRERLGLSQSAFGSLLHYSAMAVSRWEAGKMEPSARCYIQLGNLAGEPQGWSFWARAGLKRTDLRHMAPGDPSIVRRRSWPAFEIVHSISGVKRKARKGTPKAKLVTVPLLDVDAGTIGQGGGQFTDFSSATVEEMIAVPAPWCPNPTQTNCLRVKGTSMSPLINDGDVVAVDGSQTNPGKLNGKIVVGWHRERGLSLARLIVADGVQLLESEDREYLPVPVEKDRKWQIIGRVIWWIRRGP